MNSESRCHEEKLLEQISYGVRYLAGIQHELARHMGDAGIDSLKLQLQETEQRIMSAISDFSARVTTFFDRQATAIDGVAADVAAQTALIAQLQSTQGQITPEDQALLDQLEARTATLTTHVEALDAMNPPPPPAG